VRTVARPALPAAAPIANAEFASRRAALAAQLPDGVILAFGAREPRVDYVSFFQTPHFLYLTGIREPDAVLVGVKRAGAVSWSVYTTLRDPTREVWSGRRVGVDSAEAVWGIRGMPIQQLTAQLDSTITDGDTLSVVGDINVPNETTPEDQFMAALRTRRPRVVVKPANAVVQQLRGSKSQAELALLRRSTAITVEAHAAAARALKPGAYEYEAQADLEAVFRRRGAERPSFASIVGSGPNATTLHYNANNRQLARGDMVVVDIGSSYEGYAADMTRSYPASGQFTPAQRDVYQIVRDAQAAAERQARAGNRAGQMSDSASAVLAVGLAKLGLIEAPNATYDCGGERTCRQLSLFYMHGLGHGIGLEVHDPDRYNYSRTLEVGSVFTIEPGIYVRESLLAIVPDVPANSALRARLTKLLPTYRNIGVRIEDDYIVTATGLEWLTRSPREIAEIEAVMKRVTP
jgi:Xaa-Pro aminopeptidase